VHMPVFLLQEARQTEVKGCSVYSGEFDIHITLKVRKLPVLENKNK